MMFGNQHEYPLSHRLGKVCFGVPTNSKLPFLSNGFRQHNAVVPFSHWANNIADMSEQSVPQYTAVPADVDDSDSSNSARTALAAARRRAYLGIGATVATACVAVVVAVVVLSLRRRSHSAAQPSSVTRACTVFCSGPLLAAVQLAAPPLFNDSKTFVDMPLLVDPEAALAAFAALGTSPDRQASTLFDTDIYALHVFMLDRADCSGAARPWPPLSRRTSLQRAVTYWTGHQGTTKSTHPC